MPSWRIYYADGSTFDSGDGAPAEAPPHGFVCAIGYDEAGDRYIMHGWDFYVWDANQWWGMDLIGLVDRFAHGGSLYAGKIGRTVTKTEWRAIMSRAHHDPDFPQ